MADEIVERERRRVPLETYEEWKARGGRYPEGRVYANWAHGNEVTRRGKVACQLVGLQLALGGMTLRHLQTAVEGYLNGIDGERLLALVLTAVPTLDRELRTFSGDPVEITASMVKGRAYAAFRDPKDGAPSVRKMGTVECCFTNPKLAPLVDDVTKAIECILALEKEGHDLATIRLMSL